MSDKTSTPSSTDGLFIRAIDASDLNDEAAVGGKARSLARLAALALPTPRAFAVRRSLWNTLRASGPPLPAQLTTAGDLSTLDAAREALLGAPFPATFEDELQRALDDLEGSGPAPGGGGVTFAVRSSADTEDRAGALGAGLYASLLRIRRADVPDAIRRVLASFVTPAAWAYGAASGRDAGRGPRDAGGAVLLHAFVEGQASGAAAGETTIPGDGDNVRIDATRGTPTNIARDKITAAVRATTRAHGPSEIEWVADHDQVTFLQLRAYHPAPAATITTRSSDDDTSGAFVAAMAATNPDGPWTWDAAHNPLPLSPAQAGLVELCDGHSALGFRQQVIHGYLFFRAVPAPRARPPADAWTAFQELSVNTGARLRTLGREPHLEDALDLFIAAYLPLFGTVAPACATARKALADFIARRFPRRAADLPILLGGMSSVAQRRRAGIDAITTATTATARQAAVETYLGHFGDESPRWDVAEPTLAETPERLLLFAASASKQAPHPPGWISPFHRAQEMARSMRNELPPPERPHFDALVTAARQAVAVGEDDDALFARLQASVRRALLAAGRRLVAAGRLDDIDDVFYLPLPTLRAPPESGPGPTHDLRKLSAEGRRAFRAAAAAPPRVPARAGCLIVHGRPGAGGRVIGRAVHHPPSVPLGPDAILIAATLLPTELPLFSPAAIVVETGHELGHVAAQARERGIPAVVGAAGALAAIPEQALIAVDGDRGEVIQLSP